MTKKWGLARLRISSGAPGRECVQSMGVTGTLVQARGGEAGRAITGRAWKTLIRILGFSLTAVGRGPCLETGRPVR